MLKLLFMTFISLSVSAYVPEEKAGQQNELPDAIEGVGIDEKLNDQLPKNLKFMDETGAERTLESYLGTNKPVILSLVYYSCPSLCNLHLKGVFDVLSQLKLKSGKDYNFLAVSFDPKEDSDVAGAKRESYINEYLKSDAQNTQGIHFLTGDQKNIKSLAEAVGFKYKWNEDAKEWAHASAAIMVTPDGKISRYLHGVYFNPKTFRLSVVEASRGLIGSIVDSFALFCFRYDPKANKYSFYVFNIMRAAGLLMLAVLLAWLVPLWMRGRKEV